MRTGQTLKSTSRKGNLVKMCHKIIKNYVTSRTEL